MADAIESALGDMDATRERARQLREGLRALLAEGDGRRRTGRIPRGVQRALTMRAPAITDSSDLLR